MRLNQQYSCITVLGTVYCEDLIIGNWLQILHVEKSEFLFIGSRKSLQFVKDNIHNVTATINKWY